MQKLHLVGFTTDLDGLILGARKGAKSGNFVVPLDDRLLRTIEEALHLREEQGQGADPLHVPDVLRRPPRVESALTVREIQERLRAGRSLEAVAGDAGVEPEWVERFAAPVLAEQARIIDRARQLVYDKPRFGPSRLPLGDAVVRNIAQRGVRLDEDDLAAGWSAYQVHDGLWGVRFRYVSRGRPQEAEWLLDIEADELTSNNRLAAQLGYLGSGRRAATKRVAPRKAAKRSRPRKAPAKKAPAKRSRATTSRTTTSRANPSRGRKASPKKAPTSRAGTKRPPVKRSATKRSATKRSAAKRTSARRRPVKKGAGRKASGTKKKRGSPARPSTPPAATPAVPPAADPSVLLPIVNPPPAPSNGRPTFREDLVQPAAPLPDGAGGDGERSAPPRRRARPLRAR